MKVERETGKITVDLGGEWDGSCCGEEAKLLNRELEQLGIRLTVRHVMCRLPILERFQAKNKGECAFTHNDAIAHALKVRP
jgi:hypothetical protein